MAFTFGTASADRNEKKKVAASTKAKIRGLGPVAARSGKGMWEWCVEVISYKMLPYRET
jgi:hypothetical protein